MHLTAASKSTDCIQIISNKLIAIWNLAATNAMIVTSEKERERKRERERFRERQGGWMMERWSGLRGWRSGGVCFHSNLFTLQFVFSERVHSFCLTWHFTHRQEECVRDREKEREREQERESKMERETNLIYASLYWDVCACIYICTHVSLCVCVYHLCPVLL